VDGATGRSNSKSKAWSDNVHPESVSKKRGPGSGSFKIVLLPGPPRRQGKHGTTISGGSSIMTKMLLEKQPCVSRCIKPSSVKLMPLRCQEPCSPKNSGGKSEPPKKILLDTVGPGEVAVST